VQLAVVVTPPPPAELAIVETAPTPAPAPVETLPDTASSLPLIALFGMLSLGGALAVRSMRNRTI
jgi:LPXTG-motif cell wall-anchored protein